VALLNCAYYFIFDNESRGTLSEIHDISTKRIEVCNPLGADEIYMHDSFKQLSWLTPKTVFVVFPNMLSCIYMHEMLYNPLCGFS